MNFGHNSAKCKGRWWHTATVAACLAGQFAGCKTPREVHYLGEAELQHYQRSATQVDYAHVHTEIDPRIQFAEKPPTVRDPSMTEVWELTLPDAVQLALNSSTILRTRGSFKSPANPLMTNPDRVASKLDPALQETNATFIQRGPEAALSAFDTTFKTTMNWGRDESVQNNFLLSGGLFGGQELVSETARFQSSLSKVFAQGGMFEVSHNWNYTGTNQNFQLFPSSYRGYLRADYRQPLLQGAGTEYTRIEGPILRSIPGFTGLGNGVVIARINTDISIADFELAVTSMVRDVEDLYWELYLAYRVYDAQLAARDAAHSFWKHAQQMQEVGRGSRVDEAQARDNFFNTRSQLENAVAQLYANEGQLRRLLGLPVSDGRFIRPIDEPLTAEFLTDWRLALSESLVRRVELRRQKWQIKSLELQLTAAESLVKPRLDFIAGYQVNGFGDELISQQSADGVTADGYNSAYTTLTRGDQTAWDLGFDFTLPIGLRQALSNKRHAELRLAKARAVLAAQELEISHELGNSVQLIDLWYQLSRSNFDRKNAATQVVAATEMEYNEGRIPVDLLLRSEASKAAAEVGYFTALIKYNQAITDMRVRRGTLLEDNNIHLAESDWTPEAYDEALRRAWARSFAKPAPKLKTEPPEFVEGDWGRYVLDGHDMQQGLPAPAEMGGEAPYEDGAPPPSPVPEAPGTSRLDAFPPEVAPTIEPVRWPQLQEP
jgi:outer membrane protein TolC